ncbi:MAG: protein phosphatase CheZ [Pseudomonadota bacterium]|jgi:chemotaxis protein CheZ
MAKKFRFDDSGDSDELQALFDSIASQPAKPRLEVVSETDPSGDSDELQALFDQVAAEAASKAAPAPVGQVPREEKQGGHSCDAVFQRLGHLTRELHNTLRELGYDQALQQAAHAIPDARQRLAYIAQMTEQAASRVLNATDIAKPIQDQLQGEAQVLAARWDKLYRAELGVDEFKNLAADTRAFLLSVPRQTAATNKQLMEIMMAQDFQDLTGQVIKKVVDMAQNLETQLLQVLIEAMPEEVRAGTPEGLLNGPVVSAEGRADVVTAQEQVDELLESLGF